MDHLLCGVGSASFSGQMGKKSRKEELKQPDEFISFFERVVEKLTPWKREVLIAFLSLLVVAVVGFVYWNHRNQKNLAAADALAEVLKTLPQGVAMVPPGEADPKEKSWEGFLSGLESFLKEHSGASVEGVALLYQGRAMSETGDYDNALEVYGQAGRSLSPPFNFLAREGEAFSLMELRQWDQAERVFSELAQEEGNPLRAVHMWNLGLAQEAGNRPSEALKTYDRFEEAFAGSPLLERVQLRRLALRPGRGVASK